MPARFPAGVADPQGTERNGLACTVQRWGGGLAWQERGEGIVIPLDRGEAIADGKIHAVAYSNGVNEATVNVCVVGL